MEPQQQPPSSKSNPVPPPAGGQVPPGAPPQQQQPGQYPPGYPPPGYPPGYPFPPQGYAAYPPGYMPPPGYAYPPQQMPPSGYMPQGYAPPPPGYAMPAPTGYMPQGYPGYQTGPMMPPGAGMPVPPPPSNLQMPAQQPPPPQGVPAPSVAVARSAPVSVPAPSIPAPSGTVPAVPAPSGVVPAAGVAVVVEEGDESYEEGAEEEEPTGAVYHPPALTHIEEVKPENAFVRAWKKIGGGSLTLSLAIHAGLILVAGLIVFTVQAAQKQVDFLPGGGTAQGAQASSDMKHKVQQKKRSTISKNVPMKKVVSNSQNAAITLPDAPPDLLDVPDVSSMMGGSMGSGGFGAGGAGGGFGKGIGMGGAAGFVSLPPSMRSRCSASERLEKLRQTGGRPECEAAVTKSLAWFKTKQNPDGSWGRGNKAAMTGLALLCYLGRCETPDSPFYGENVMKGIMYLIELSKKNPHGIISEGWEGNKGGAGTYEHGIATYALGEMYTLARLGSKSLPGMREAFEKGVEVIIKNQKPNGAWTYGGTEIVYNPGPGGEDLSVVGWQYQALKAAKNTSLKINGLHQAIDKTIDYLLTKQTKDGGFGRDNRDEHYNQWSLSGCGILGLQTLGKGQKKKEIAKGMKFLRDFLTAEPLDWNKNCNLYCWYYYTQAFFQAGGDDWKFYNEMFLPQILAAQQPDGAFKRGRANWPAGDAADEIYRQTLCTLQLEVYYRYLKVSDRDDDSFFDK